jgi:hypothetical protein
VIIESKLKSGTLTFDSGATPASFACQATNVRITPSANTSGDEVETLCGDVLAPETKVTWVLAGTSVSDFTDSAGFVQFTWEHELESLDFEWTPNGTTGPTYSGNVVIVPVEVGGDVNVRLTTDWEWNLNGKPTVTF